MIRSHAQLNSPIRKKRRRFEHNYDRQHLNAVVQKVKDGELTINSAADLYAIPRTTISSRLRKDGWYSKDSIPSDPQLPHEIKAELLVWLKKMEEIACPGVIKALPFVIQEICEMFGEHTVFPADNLPSEEYCERLLTELHDTTGGFSTDLCSKLNVSVIDCWLKKLRSLFENHYGLDADTFLSGGECNIGQIFCCFQLATLLRRDDGSSGILVNSFPGEVHERQQLLTMYTCLGVDGSTLSPLFVVRSRSSEQKYFVNPTDSDASFEVWSREGGMNADVLLDWLQLIVHEIGDRETNKPLLIFLDQSVECVSLVVLDFCQVHMIILFYLPGQSGVSHLAFGSRIFDVVFQRFSENSGKGKRTISKTSSLSILPELWSHLHSDSVSFEFQRLGLVPLNDQILKQSLKFSNPSNEARDRVSVDEDAVQSSSRGHPPSALEIFSVASEKGSALPISLAELKGRKSQSKKKLTKQSKLGASCTDSKSCYRTLKRKFGDSCVNLSKTSQNVRVKQEALRQNKKSVIKTNERKRKRLDSFPQEPHNPEHGVFKTALVSSSQTGKETSYAVENPLPQVFQTENKSASYDNRISTCSDGFLNQSLTSHKSETSFLTKSISFITPTVNSCPLRHEECQNSVEEETRTSCPLQIPVNRHDESVNFSSCSTKNMNTSKCYSCGRFTVPLMDDRLQGAHIGVSQALRLVESSLSEDLLLLYRQRLSRMNECSNYENFMPMNSNVFGLNGSVSSKSDPILRDPSFIIWSKLKQSLTSYRVSLTDETLAVARCVQTAFEHVCNQECECKIAKNWMKMSSIGTHENCFSRNEENLSSQLTGGVPVTVYPKCGPLDSPKNFVPRNIQRSVGFREFLVEKVDQLQLNMEIDRGHNSQTSAPQYQLPDKAFKDNFETGCNNKAYRQQKSFPNCQHVKPPFICDSGLKPALQQSSEALLVADMSSSCEIHSPIKLESFETAFGFFRQRSSSSNSMAMNHREITSNCRINPVQKIANSKIKLESGTSLYHRPTFICGDPHDGFKNHSEIPNNYIAVTQTSDNCLHQNNLWNNSSTYRDNIGPSTSTIPGYSLDVSSSQFSDSGISLVSGEQTPRLHSGLSNCCSNCYPQSFSTNCSISACSAPNDNSLPFSFNGSSVIPSTAHHQQNRPNITTSVPKKQYGDQSMSHPNSILEDSALDSPHPGINFVQEPNLMSPNPLKTASSNIGNHSTVHRLPEVSKFTTNHSVAKVNLQSKEFVDLQDRQQLREPNSWVQKFGVNQSHLRVQPIVSTPTLNMYRTTASESEYPSSNRSLMPNSKEKADCNSHGGACNVLRQTVLNSFSTQAQCSAATMENVHSFSSGTPQRVIKFDTSFASPSFSRNSRVSAQYPVSTFPITGEILKSMCQNASTVYSLSENTTKKDLSSTTCRTTTKCAEQLSVMHPFHDSEKTLTISPHFPCASNSHSNTCTHKLECDDLELSNDNKTNFGARHTPLELHSYSIAAAGGTTTVMGRTNSSNASTRSDVGNVEQSGTPAAILNATLKSAESEFNIITSTPQMKNCTDKIMCFREVTGAARDSPFLPKPPLLAARKPVSHDRVDASEEAGSTRRLFTRSSGRKKLSRILPAEDDSSFSDDERDFVIDEGENDVDEPIRQKFIFDGINDQEESGGASASENFVECEDKQESLAVCNVNDGNGSKTFEQSRNIKSPDGNSSTSKQDNLPRDYESDPLSIDNFDSELPSALTLDDISDVLHTVEQFSSHEEDIHEHGCLPEYQTVTEDKVNDN